MSTKLTKTKTTEKNKERFYRFATALMAVPKKELDKAPQKHPRMKHPKRKS